MLYDVDIGLGQVEWLLLRIFSVRIEDVLFWFIEIVWIVGRRLVGQVCGLLG